MELKSINFTQDNDVIVKEAFLSLAPCGSGDNEGRAHMCYRGKGAITALDRFLSSR